MDAAYQKCNSCGLSQCKKYPRCPAITKHWLHFIELNLIVKMADAIHVGAGLLQNKSLTYVDNMKDYYSFLCETDEG